MQRLMEKMRRELFSKYVADPINLFYSVKGGRNTKSSLRNPEAISKTDLYEFLREYSIEGISNINDELIDSIMRRLDHDCDEKIKYLEFLEAITPFHIEGLAIPESKSPIRTRKEEKDVFYRTI